MNPNKTRYRTTNWPEYNRSLQNRGSLTVWISPDILWLDGARRGAQGRPKVYSDAAIQAILTLKVVFKLALRQARGLVSSLLKLLELDWPVPCFSTVSRRQATLTVKIPHRRQTGPLHLLVDSTGIKICGEGEWKCRFQKTAAPNVRSRLHYSSGGVGSIRQRRTAAGHQET